jgi:hypothetical protein
MGVTAGQDQSSEEFNAAKEKTTIYHAEGDQSPNNGLAEKALVDPAIDPVKERAMVKKIDKYVIPMVMVSVQKTYTHGSVCICILCQSQQ